MANVIYQVSHDALEVINETLRVTNDALQVTNKALQVSMDEQVAKNEALKVANDELREANDAFLTINGNLRKVVSEFKSEVKIPTGLLPVCTSCGRIKGGGGTWIPIAQYIKEHTSAKITETLCPECSKKYIQS
jgi:hypothetical protein